METKAVAPALVRTDGVVEQSRYEPMTPRASAYGWGCMTFSARLPNPLWSACQFCPPCSGCALCPLCTLPTPRPLCTLFPSCSLCLALPAPTALAALAVLPFYPLCCICHAGFHP
jgi:hypothetical protein